jgi:hypothetical protein
MRAFRFAAVCAAFVLTHALHPTSASVAAEDDRKPVPLTGDLIRNGLQLLQSTGTNDLLKKLPYLLLRGMPDFGIHLEVDIAKTRVHIDFQIGQIQERYTKETNELLKQQLKVMLEQLEQQKRQNELLAEQLRVTKGLLDHQLRVFRYQTDGVLRKESYTVPPDKLIVVVADFSSGNPDEGREIADEIAHHLHELRKQGIDIHLLTGEVRPGIIIRSPEMAQDVGRHLPPDASYAVIWGTMSPRTVGRYRPHLTSVQKMGHTTGVSVTCTFDLESQSLPLRSDAENYQRQCYERLIGVTCAVIPSCYALFEVSRERTPDLGKFYEFVGTGHREVVQMREQLQPFMLWTVARAKGKFDYLHRLDAAGDGYPILLRNNRDNTIMTLIRDEQGKPVVFHDKAKNVRHLTYIDVTETTNRQYVMFLNQMKGNQEEGGSRWLRTEKGVTDIIQEEKGEFAIHKGDAAMTEYHKDAAVVDVSWFGAGAYCTWAGKSLPRVEEWQTAARPKGAGNHPWGTATDVDGRCYCEHNPAKFNPLFKYNVKVGSFPLDRSRIGCFDMAGNVAEWCADWQNEPRERTVCGGSSFDMKDPKCFEITHTRPMAPVTHANYVGFRGVVRVPVE